MKTSQTFFRFTPLLACGLAAVSLSFAGTSAFAASPTDATTYSVKVQYNPRDLTTEEGTQKIYGKIKRAARQVCSMTSVRGDLARARHYQQCYNAALSKGVDDVNSKNLTA